MGADFLFTAIPAIDIDKARGKVAYLTDGNLADVQQILTGWDLDDLDREEGISWRTDTRLALYEALEYVKDDQRNIAWFVCDHGQKYWIAGGTSWGDNPEGCDELSIIHAAGLTDPDPPCRTIPKPQDDIIGNIVMSGLLILLIIGVAYIFSKITGQ